MVTLIPFFSLRRYYPYRFFGSPDSIRTLSLVYPSSP
jgi:hypothetical protein